VHSEILQFMRFIVVGFVNTAFGYGVYGLLLRLGVVLPLALLGANVLGILFNFLTTGHLVFRAFAWSRLPRFLLVYVAMWLLGTVVIARLAQLGPMGWMATRAPILVDWTEGWTPLALEQFTAGVLVMPFSTLLTYLLLRSFVHTHSAPPDER